jgi:hypothetical protein
MSILSYKCVFFGVCCTLQCHLTLQLMSPHGYLSFHLISEALPCLSLSPSYGQAIVISLLLSRSLASPHHQPDCEH